LVTVLATPLGLFGELSWADQVLHSPKQGVQAQLKTDVQGATATQGQPFDAVLTEDVRYKNQVLPAGTDFQGEITQVRHSRRFSRPGYVVLHVEQATLPNGQTFSFDPARYTPRDNKLHHPDSLSFAQTVGYQLPYTLVALAVTVPLHYAADVDSLPLIPVGEGIRMGAGALFGLVRPKFRNEPVARKLALGAMDGSGIPRVVGFFTKYPEPDYHAGDTVTLYMNPNGLKDLLNSASSSSTPQASLETHGRIQAAQQP
jgi:hypothetical protein